MPKKICVFFLIIFILLTGGVGSGYSSDNLFKLQIDNETFVLPSGKVKIQVDYENWGSRIIDVLIENGIRFKLALAEYEKDKLYDPARYKIYEMRKSIAEFLPAELNLKPGGRYVLFVYAVSPGPHNDPIGLSEFGYLKVYTDAQEKFLKDEIHPYIETSSDLGDVLLLPVPRDRWYDSPEASQWNDNNILVFVHPDPNLFSSVRKNGPFANLGGRTCVIEGRFSDSYVCDQFDSEKSYLGEPGTSSCASQSAVGDYYYNYSNHLRGQPEMIYRNREELKQLKIFANDEPANPSYNLKEDILVYDTNADESIGIVYDARKTNFANPEKLPFPINSPNPGEINFQPFLDGREKRILWTSNRDGSLALYQAQYERNPKTRKLEFGEAKSIVKVKKGGSLIGVAEPSTNKSGDLYAIGLFVTGCPSPYDKLECMFTTAPFVIRSEGIK